MGFLKLVFAVIVVSTVAFFKALLIGVGVILGMALAIWVLQKIYGYKMMAKMKKAAAEVIEGVSDKE